jgi:hypothetical protein
MLLNQSTATNITYSLWMMQNDITVNFVKKKSEAAQGVINYLTHLITQGRKPKGIQINGGKEFVNEKLEKWCKEKGIEI